MNIQLTRPMEKAMTQDLLQKIERAALEFPELDACTVKIGLVMNSNVHGSADSTINTIRLNTMQKSGMSYFTIAHELTHLLQKPGLGTVPNGEVQCDIYALARSPLFTDDMPTYLPGLRCNKREWKQHATAVRELCVEAIKVRSVRRTYIMWLTQALDHYFRGLLNGQRS
jgi:hypothetical protein